MFGRHPVLGLATAIALGALGGDSASWQQGWVLVALGAFLSGLVLVRPESRVAGAALLAAGLTTGAAGMAATNTAYERQHRRASVVGLDGPMQLIGKAASDLVPGDPRRRFMVRVEAVRSGGRVERWSGGVSLRVAGETELPEIPAGRRLAVWATLQAPHGPRSPGTPDARDRALRAGIHAFGTVKSPALITPQTPRLAIGEVAGRARARARAALGAGIHGPNERGLVAALLFGDRSGLPAVLQDSYRRAGVLHVIAVSGAQVALVAAIGWRVMKRLRLPRAVATSVLCAGVAAYAAVAGAEASVLRATIMAVAAAVAAGLDLDKQAFDLLGAAAFALLSFDPASTFDPGFQLSVAATAGLVAFARRWSVVVPSVPILGWALAASLAAQVGVLPLQIALFHTVPLGATAANLVAVPLSSAVLVGGLVFVFLGTLVPSAAPAAGAMVEMVAMSLNGFVSWWGSLPAMELTVPRPPLWVGVAYVGGLLALVRGAAPRRAGPLVAAGLIGGVLAGGPRADGRLHLFAVDVGQGDALVLVSPHGRAMVIDTGPGLEERWSAARNVVGPLLWDLGIARVDRLLVTHAHADHVGAAGWLIRTFGVAELWEGPAPRSAEVASRLLSTVVGSPSLDRITVLRGHAVSWDGVDLRVLGPNRPRVRPTGVRNDDSVVVAVEYGAARLLLTGDIEAEGELNIDRRAYDVVKVPHHGSRSSSSPGFVAATCPSVAFVSVGAANRFGHPNAAVVGRYANQGTLLLRTDRDGTLHAATDGRSVEVSAYVLGRWSRVVPARAKCLY